MSIGQKLLTHFARSAFLTTFTLALRHTHTRLMILLRIWLISSPTTRSLLLSVAIRVHLIRSLVSISRKFLSDCFGPLLQYLTFYRNLTGGAYNAETLGENNNAACFGLQVLYAGSPSALTTLLKPAISLLGCPQLNGYNNAVYEQFPGYSKAGKGGLYNQ
jgi:hypothetical protein